MARSGLALRALLRGGTASSAAVVAAVYQNGRMAATIDAYGVWVWAVLRAVVACEVPATAALDRPAAVGRAGRPVTTATAV